MGETSGRGQERWIDAIGLRVYLFFEGSRRWTTGREDWQGSVANAISLVAAGVAVPVVVFLMNLFVRIGRGIAQSSAADFLLLLVVFDASVIIAADQFRPLVRDPVIGEAIVPVYVVLLLVTIFVWLMAVLYVEPAISYDPVARTYRSRFPVFAWMGSWIAAGFMFFVHAWGFTQGATRWTASWSLPQWWLSAMPS